MARDIFISYRNEDREAAARICEALEKNGISCWIAPRDIPAGVEWPMAITAGLKRCHTLVLILSSHSKVSKQIAREVESADRNGANILTFRIEDVMPPPSLEYFLQNIQWIDGFGNRFEEGIAALVAAVRRNQAFPAEKTKMHQVASVGGTAAAARMAPAPMAVAEPQAVAGPRNRMPMMALAGVAAVCLAGAGTWMATRGGKAETNVVVPPDREPEKREVTPVNRDTIKPAPVNRGGVNPAPVIPTPVNPPAPSPVNVVPPGITAQQHSKELTEEAAKVASTDGTQALEKLEPAIRLDPKNGDAYYWRGLVYRNRRSFDEAISDFDKAIELGSDVRSKNRAYVGRGQAYQAQKKFTDAEEAFTAVIKGKGGWGEWIEAAYRGRAAVRRAQGNVEGAEADRAELDRQLAVRKRKRE